MLTLNAHNERKTFSFWGLRSQTPYRGFAPRPHWGLPLALRSYHHFVQLLIFLKNALVTLAYTAGFRNPGLNFHLPLLLSLSPLSFRSPRYVPFILVPPFNPTRGLGVLQSSSASPGGARPSNAFWFILRLKITRFHRIKHTQTCLKSM